MRIYCVSAIRRVFTQHSLRAQTERKYHNLPEILSKKAEKKRKEDYRTNRLMAEVFAKVCIFVIPHVMYLKLFSMQFVMEYRVLSSDKHVKSISILTGLENNSMLPFEHNYITLLCCYVINLYRMFFGVASMGTVSRG